MTCATIFNLPEALFRRCYPDPDDGIRHCLIAPTEFLRLACPMDQPVTVLGHEGRHRLQALVAAGYALVEIVVEATPDPRRFADLDALLTWTWDGQLPDWTDLRPETVWRDAACS